MVQIKLPLNLQALGERYLQTRPRAKEHNHRLRPTNHKIYFISNKLKMQLIYMRIYIYIDIYRERYAFFFNNLAQISKYISVHPRVQVLPLLCVSWGRVSQAADPG